jgi:hypothetical protein
LGFHVLFSALRFTLRFAEAVEVDDLPCIIVGQVEEAGDGLAGDALPVEFPHPFDVPRGGADPVLPALEVRDSNGIWREIWRSGHQDTRKLVESLYGGFYGGCGGTGRRRFIDLGFDQLGPVLNDHVHFLGAHHDVLEAEVIGVAINSDNLGV